MKNTNQNEKNTESKDNLAGTTHQLPPKIRVHSLAKLLGTSSKDILKFLGKQGGTRKNAHSNIDRENAEIIRDHIHNANPSQENSSTDIDGKQTHQHNYQNFFVAPQPVPTQPGQSEKRATNSLHNEDNSPANRKKTRRGRRGRGRGKGEFTLAQQVKDENASGEFLVKVDDLKINPLTQKSTTSRQDTSSTSSTSSSTPTARRTRKRKKANPETDLEPNSTVLGDDIADTIIEHTEEDGSTVVVHERSQRRSRPPRSDKPTGVSGSTRMAAKRQRRRELRAPKSRTSLLYDEEFLARRKAIERIMVVREKQNSSHEHYTQVGVLEDGVLVEHFVTTDASSSMVGNIYLGEIQNVLPSMEAAFVNIGQGRNAVLYAGEVDWDASGLTRKNRRIEEVLTTGNQVLVQVTKDPVGQKGARLTTQISIAGRYLVFVPGGNSIGISRRLPEVERRRLKTLLSEILPPDCGVIVRTAAEGVSAEDFTADLERLRKQWEEIETEVKKVQEAKNPKVKTLYEEPDFLVKVVRDLFNEDFSKLIIDGDGPWKTVENYISTVASDLMEKVERFVPTAENPVDFFNQYKIEEQLSKALDRKVWLPSGGTLIIERTEAMTVIDVNTGKYVGEGGNLEETVTRNNLEAAEEIVRQLRLRDIGGMIIVDFIDMIMQTNQDLVLATLEKELSLDRTRHQISEITSLGLVQITRKKIGTGLLEAFSTTCEHCQGLGLIIHNDPVEELPPEELESHRPQKRNHKRNDKFSYEDGKGAGAQSESSQSHHRNNSASSPSRTEHPLFKVMAKGSQHDSPDSHHSEHPALETDPSETHPRGAQQSESTEKSISNPQISMKESSAAKITKTNSNEPKSGPREAKRNRGRRRASRPMQTSVIDSSETGNLTNMAHTAATISTQITSEISALPIAHNNSISNIDTSLINVESTPRKSPAKKTQRKTRNTTQKKTSTEESSPVGNTSTSHNSTEKTSTEDNASQLKSIPTMTKIANRKQPNSRNNGKKPRSNTAPAIDSATPNLSGSTAPQISTNPPLAQTRSRSRAASRPADMTKN